MRFAADPPFGFANKKTISAIPGDAPIARRWGVTIDLAENFFEGLAARVVDPERTRTS